MPAPFGVLSPGEAGAEAPGLLDKLVAGIINGTVQIPKHVIDAAASTAPPGLRREDYTDVPAPGGLTQAWQPGDAQRGATLETAFNLAGVGAPFATSGSAGIFGGRLAATADKAALAEAERLAASGADRQAIWDKTGWFKGADEKWRFEIPDYNSQMNQGWHDKGLPNYDLGRVAGQLWHKPLYDAYPDLRKATGMVEKGERARGSYSPAGTRKSEEETLQVVAPNAPAARSIMLHEAQHGIQEREGFAQGGSPNMFTQGEDSVLARNALSYRREIEKLDPSLTPKQKDDIIRKQYEEIGAPDWFPSQAARDIAHDVEGNPAHELGRVMQLYGTDQRTAPFGATQLYRELPGEVEARNVQARMDMTPAELRAKPPWMTQDTTPRPVMNEIFGGGRVGSLQSGPQMSVPVRRVGYKAMDSAVPNMQPDTGLSHVALDRSVAEQFSGGGKRKVNEVEVSAQKPFDYRDPVDLQWLVREMQKPKNVAAYNRDVKKIMGPNYEHVADARFIQGGLEEGLYQAYEVPAVINIIKGRGYDGIYMTENVGSPTNLAVFHPSQISLKGKK